MGVIKSLAVVAKQPMCYREDLKWRSVNGKEEVIKGTINKMRPSIEP